MCVWLAVWSGALMGLLMGDGLQTTVFCLLDITLNFQSLERTLVSTERQQRPQTVVLLGTSVKG